MRILGVLSLLVLASAQAPGITGTWSVTYDADMRRVSETEWKVNRRATGTLVLQQRGDSVFGRWQTELMPDGAELRGTFDGRTLKLTTGTRDIVGQVNGKPERMRVRNDWTATVEGRSARGVMFIHVGDRPAPGRKWEATLQRG